MGRPIYVWHGAASLRRRLALESPTPIADGAGGIEIYYKEVGKLWACVVSASPSALGMRDRMDRRESATCYSITLRWRRGITTAHRFRDEDQIFKIMRTEDPDGHRQRLVCMTEIIAP
jgi:head-tail adaptor